MTVHRLKDTHHSQGKTNQSGVVMTEAAISLLVFLGVLGLFIDLGFSLYRYSRIYRVAQDTVKEYSLQLAKSDKTCEELQGEIRSFAKNRLKQEFNVANSYEFNPSFNMPSLPSSDDIRSLSLQGVWPLSCAMCLFTGKLTVKVFAEQPIEAPDFWCSTE